MGPEMAKVAQDVERTGTYKGVKLHKVGTTTLHVMRKEVIGNVSLENLMANITSLK